MINNSISCFHCQEYQRLQSRPKVVGTFELYQLSSVSHNQRWKIHVSCLFPTKREKNHPIINIESGRRGELASCPNWDRSAATKQSNCVRIPNSKAGWLKLKWKFQFNSSFKLKVLQSRSTIYKTLQVLLLRTSNLSVALCSRGNCLQIDPVS